MSEDIFDYQEKIMKLGYMIHMQLYDKGLAIRAIKGYDKERIEISKIISKEEYSLTYKTLVWSKLYQKLLKESIKRKDTYKEELLSTGGYPLGIEHRFDTVPPGTIITEGDKDADYMSPSPTESNAVADTNITTVSASSFPANCKLTGFDGVGVNLNGEATGRKDCVNCVKLGGGTIGEDKYFCTNKCEDIIAGQLSSLPTDYVYSPTIHTAKQCGDCSTIIGCTGECELSKHLKDGCYIKLYLEPTNIEFLPVKEYSNGKDRLEVIGERNWYYYTIVTIRNGKNTREVSPTFYKEKQ